MWSDSSEFGQNLAMEVLKFLCQSCRLGVVKSRVTYGQLAKDCLLNFSVLETAMGKFLSTRIPDNWNTRTCNFVFGL